MPVENNHGCLGLKVSLALNEVWDLQTIAVDIAIASWPKYLHQVLQLFLHWLTLVMSANPCTYQWFWKGMHCSIRSSKSIGRAHRSLIERFWKGLDCSTMPSKTNAEGNKPFCKESHGPGHPGGGNHPPPGGGPWDRGPGTYMHFPRSAQGQTNNILQQ